MAHQMNKSNKTTQLSNIQNEQIIISAFQLSNVSSACTRSGTLSLGLIMIWHDVQFLQLLSTL